MKLGALEVAQPLVLAPMAGITDLPFRHLCCLLGADWAISEMLSSNPRVWSSLKSKLRMAGDVNEQHLSEPIKIVQIAGSQPEELAMAAQYNEAQGADVIDINMGCPAKKVNKKLAGSALLKEPLLVKEILNAVITAVNVPVSLKIRTGWSPEERNGLEIAQLAQDCGVAALSVHGRTRQCMFKGQAEFDTIKAIKQAVSIPVIANGDINTVEKAQQVLEYTAVDGLMIGRAAQGNPWLFREVKHYLNTQEILPGPSVEEFKQVMLQHLSLLHQLYGTVQGVRIARKHVSWYLSNAFERFEFKNKVLKEVRVNFNKLESAECQYQAINNLFSTIK